jgi:hypothetical protein
VKIARYPIEIAKNDATPVLHQIFEQLMIF